MMKTKTLWKSMLYEKGKLRSGHGNESWKLGEWHKVDGPLAMCNRGYHASLNIVDSMQYVAPGAIAKVEVRGKHAERADKQCWSEMRVAKAWEWTKRDSVELAVYAAELVIGRFEKQYPDDKRPRAAIEAAKAWLKNPCEKTSAAAFAAARAAARAASDAERDASDAAMAAMKARIHRWIVRRTKSMKEIKEGGWKKED